MNKDKTKLYNELISMGYDTETARQRVSVDSGSFSGIKEPQESFVSRFGRNLVQNPITEGIKAPFQATGEAIKAFGTSAIEAEEQIRKIQQDKTIAGKQSFGSKSLQTLGQFIKPFNEAAGAAFGSVASEVNKDVFGGQADEAIAKGVNVLLKTDTGKQVGQFASDIGDVYDYTKETNPALAQNLEAGASVVELGLSVLSGGVGKTVGGQTLKTTSKLGSMVNTAKNTTEIARKKVPRLRDVFKGRGVSGGRILDTAIEGSAKIADTVQKFPEVIGKAVKGSITRNLVRTAKESPTKAKNKILDLYKRGIVPGVKKKNKTIANIKSIGESVKRVVPILSKKYDPVDIDDFANAINFEKKNIYKEIEKGIGDVESRVDMTKIVNELKTLLKSERADFSSDLKRSAQTVLNDLVRENGVIKKVSPQGAQQIIADIHAELQSFYRGSTSGTNSDVVVKNLVLNNLKRDLDDLVTKSGGEFKKLKSQYSDLKKLEDDVVHRAVFEAQKGGGLGDLTDIFAAGDIIGGTLGANPAFLAKGVGQYFTKEIVKSLNDKNELIRQMFVLGKNLTDEPIILKSKPISPKKIKTYKKSIKEVRKSQRFISDKAYERAKKNLSNAKNRLNSGVPIDEISDMVVIAAYHIENGVVSAVELMKKIPELTREQAEKLIDKAKLHLEAKKYKTFDEFFDKKNNIKNNKTLIQKKIDIYDEAIADSVSKSLIAYYKRGIKELKKYEQITKKSDLNKIERLLEYKSFISDYRTDVNTTISSKILSFFKKNDISYEQKFGERNGFGYDKLGKKLTDGKGIDLLKKEIKKIRSELKASIAKSQLRKIYDKAHSQ